MNSRKKTQMPVSLSRFKRVRGLLVLFASLLLLTSATIAGDNRPSLALLNQHVFSGFGLNMWVGDLPLESQVGLLKQLNVNAVRISITPGVDVAKLAQAKTESDFEKLIETEGSDSWRKSLTDFGKRSRELHLEVHVVFYSTPAPWRSDRPRAGNLSKIDRFADSNHISDEAKWIAASLEAAERLGLNVDFVEIANEPDGPWNTLYTPDQYADLLLDVRTALANVGLNEIKIEGAGSSNLSADAGYIKMLEQRSQLPLLAALSGHDYMIEGPPYIGATPLEEARKTFGQTVPVHITEFSDASPRWGKTPYKTLPAKRGPDNGADSLAFGLDVAAEGLRLIADSASEIFLWELQDESWEGQSYGIIDLHGQSRSLLGALLATVARIPTNSNVTGVKVDNAVFVFARSSSGFLLTGVNPDDKPVAVSLKLGISAAEHTQMNTFCFPENKNVGVRFDSAKSEVSLTVPASTAFSFLWST